MHQLLREPQGTHTTLVASAAGGPSTSQGGRINYQKSHEVSKGSPQKFAKGGKGEVTCKWETLRVLCQDTCMSATEVPKPLNLTLTNQL